MMKHKIGKHLSRENFQDLMKVLKIKLPKGVLKTDVVNRSRDKAVIKDAKAIVTDLENFQLQFAKTPRLACREVKTALQREVRQTDILRITKMIFFKKPGFSNESLEQQWKNNKSKTVCGFKMRRLYQMNQIAAPDMEDPKSFGEQHVEENQAFITKGRDVPMKDLLQSSVKSLPSSHHFGNHAHYQRIEMLCLRFFHQRCFEDQDPAGKVTYSKGNKVEFGFFSGRLDFLASICNKKCPAVHKIVIECKGTRGDMVGNVFKPIKDHRAELNKNHQYYYQTLTYRYILENAKSTPAAARAVMVLRYEEKENCSDFFWNDVQENSEQIHKLRRFCEQETLPRFLAVLNLIFENANTRKKTR